MNSDTLSKYKSLQQSLVKERATLVARLAAIDAVLGSSAASVSVVKAPVRKGGISAAGRARIAAAQKARWAKVKKARAGSVGKPAPKTKV